MTVTSPVSSVERSGSAATPHTWGCTRAPGRRDHHQINDIHQTFLRTHRLPGGNRLRCDLWNGDVQVGERAVTNLGFTV
jgi:hypothetical protein